MSEKKHTPGPWSVNGCGKHRPNDAAWHNCVAVRAADSTSIERTPANLALMAAAPDMLAELETLRAVFADYTLHHLRKGDDEKARANNVHRERIDALIKKASP